MLRIFLASALFLGAGAAMAADQPATVPPMRASFQVRVPSEVAFGKLWMDVALFHPFSGSISRDAWEAGYFRILDTVATGHTANQQNWAEALALLGDPCSLVLPGDEGTGAEFLPVLWEGGNDGLVWIVGGDRNQVPAKFGPIASINGVSLEKFLADRVGSRPIMAQRIGALTLASRRKTEFTWEVKDSAGRRMELKSIHKVPEEIWIEGDWSGVPLHEAIKLKTRDAILGLKSLDLRMINWPCWDGAYSLISSLRYIHGTQPMAWIERGHVGFSQVNEGDPRPAVYNSGVLVRLTTEPWPIGHILPAKLPQALVHEGNLGMLAGLAFDGSVDAPAKVAFVTMPDGIRIALRTASWGSSQAVPSAGTSFSNAGLLSVPAARALAAAAIINYDSLFTYSRAEAQRKLVDGVLTLYANGCSVLEMIRYIDLFSGDAHSGAQSRGVGMFPTPQAMIARLSGSQSVAPWKRPVFSNIQTFLDSKGKVRLLRASATYALPAGAELLEVDGKTPGDLLHVVKTRTGLTPLFEGAFSTRIGDFLRPDALLNGYKIKTFDPWEKAEKETEITRFSSVAPSRFEAPGWVFATSKSQMGPKAIAEAMAAGYSVVLDMRFASDGTRSTLMDPYENPDGFPGIPNEAYFKKTASKPAEWGRGDTPTPNSDPGDRSARLEGNVWLGGAANGHFRGTLRGTLVLLVDGSTLSYLETRSLLLRELFHGHVQVAGLPSAGTTGNTAWVFLPTGEPASPWTVYSPTGMWPIYGLASPNNGAGVPLDIQITPKELESAITKGEPDPLLAALVRRLPTLRKPVSIGKGH